MPTRTRPKNLSANDRRAAAARTWRGAKAHAIKCSAETVTPIAAEVAAGVPLDAACSAGGVHRSTLRRWMQRARTFIEDGGPSEFRIYSRAARLIEEAQLTYFRTLVAEMNNTDLPVSRRRFAMDLLSRRGLLRVTGAVEPMEEPEFDPDEGFL